MPWLDRKKGIPARAFGAQSFHQVRTEPACRIYAEGPPTVFRCGTHVTAGAFEAEDEGWPERCPKGRE